MIKEHNQFYKDTIFIYHRNKSNMEKHVPARLELLV